MGQVGEHIFILKIMKHLIFPFLTRCIDALIMPPTSKKLTGILADPYLNARVFKFHLWIPHGKIFDTRFFSCPSYLPFWSNAPLKKSKWNLMHVISNELCMIGFWNFIYGFRMEKYQTSIFFLVQVISLSWVMPLWKNQNEILSARYLEKCLSKGLET